MRRPIVFLHVPKTGGQTIHHAVASTFPPEQRSPIRLMSQAGPEGPFPQEYRFHSGHLDWARLGEVADDPFVFTVLRDPRERLGSFYFYMRANRQRRADELGVDALAPRDAALLGAADAHFFPAEETALRRLRQTWENAMTNFFAFRSLTRPPRFLDLGREEMLARAMTNAKDMSAIYRFGRFDVLEDDLEALTGQRLTIADKRSNDGPLDAGVSRWEALLDRLESDANRRRMERFVDLDLELMERLTFR
jgi:hypothetical protein